MGGREEKGREEKGRAGNGHKKRKKGKRTDFREIIGNRCTVNDQNT